MKIKTNILYYFIIITVFLSACSKAKPIEIVNHENNIKNVTTENPLIMASEGKLEPEMVFVEGGEFIMGDESVITNKPHTVRLSSYYIARNMVTVAEWKQFVNDVNLEFTWDWDTIDYGLFNEIIPSDDCPAQGLNWYYAVIFCNWASLKDDLEPCYILNKIPEKEFIEISVKWDKKVNGYRLPTDAEWEFAARGGKKSEGFIYPGSNDPNEIGRFGKEYKASYPVGIYKPNELGIYDMGGNASEWCWDWYDQEIFEWLSSENPSVDDANDVQKKSQSGKDKRVLRGASWNSSPRHVARRGAYPPINIGWDGLRLVRNAESP